MKRFLDIEGVKYIISKVIGKTDISGIGDGTLKGAISSIKSLVGEKINELSKEIDVERKRINNITKLGEGSTTGDAELADVRVGVNGKKYDTAGAAVRGQVGELIEDFSKLSGEIDKVLENYADIIANETIDKTKIYEIDFSRRTFAVVKNVSTKNGYYKIALCKDGVKKQIWPAKLLGPNGTLKQEIFNTNTDNVHPDWIPWDRSTSDYQFTVEIENKDNVNMHVLIYQLKADSPDTGSKIIVENKSGVNGAFRYITDAVGYAKKKYDVQNKDVVIFIKNGHYEQPYIDSRAGVINKGANRISIIGESRDGVIIQLVSTPSKNNKIIEHGGESSIENITFKNLWNNDGSAMSGKNNAYAIHNDSEYDSNHKPYNTIVRNCYIYSEAFASVGAGLRNNQKQIYDNCTIVFNSLDETPQGYNQWAPLYVHGPGKKDARDCSLEINNCTCIARKGTAALVLPDVAGSLPYSKIPTSIRRSIFVTNGNVITKVNKTNTLITSDSGLNNVDALNY